MGDVEEAYDRNAEREWERLERHRVEYGLTLRALEDHLASPPAPVLDVGGGAGRYAIELSRRGYAVTLVDLAAGCLDLAAKQAAEAGVELAGSFRADARELGVFGDETFDAVLLMGPLYHLLEHGERLRAVREARRVLRPGGRVFAAFLNRFSIVQFAAARAVDYIRDFRDELERILSTGVHRQSKTGARLPDAWFAHPDDVSPLMAEGGFERRDLLTCESLANEIESGINEAPEELHREWIDLLYRLARDPSILGAGGHLLYVGEKG